MYKELIATYLIWFLVGYIVPLIYFFRRTRITLDMLHLTRLNLSARFDDAQQGIVSVDSDFSSFVEAITPVTPKNYAVTILQQLCIDAKGGKKVNINVYILRYKKLCRNFATNIFYLIHIPLIVSLCFFDYRLSTIITLYAICFLCVLLLKRIADAKVDFFAETLYTNWYDRIANFDLITIRELKPVILNSLKSENNNILLSALNNFWESAKICCETISESSASMNAKLDEFIALQNSADVVTWQNVTQSANDALQTIKESGKTLNVICSGISKTLPKFAKLSDKSKIDINVINKNSALLFELKELLSSYKSETLATELAHLGTVAETLENSIGNTFTSIDTTITQNAEDLRKGYEAFFDVCEKFNKTVAENFAQEMRVVALPSASNTNELEKELRAEIKNLEEKVAEATDALKTDSEINREKYQELEEKLRTEITTIVQQLLQKNENHLHSEIESRDERIDATVHLIKEIKKIVNQKMQNNTRKEKSVDASELDKQYIKTRDHHDAVAGSDNQQTQTCGKCSINKRGFCLFHSITVRDNRIACGNFQGKII
ncbi:MAG: hypothetical protein Ta2A_18280 [Treponemataceae bacterium]|nr:MAG: hypothetical protein Ta2A_18280 [Treponemataceae bacterium]